MKRRLLNACIFMMTAAIVSTCIVIWQQIDPKWPVILAVTVIGFVLGLVFQVRPD